MMKKSCVALTLCVMLTLCSLLALPLPIMAGAVEEPASSSCLIAGRQGVSPVGYSPLEFSPAHNLVLNCQQEVKVDNTGIMPVVYIPSGSEVSFSFQKPNVALVEDHLTCVGDLQLDTSVRKGAIIVEKKNLDGGFVTLSKATNVFAEDAAPMEHFFKPSYEDIKDGTTFRVTVAYAYLSRNHQDIQRHVESYEVLLCLDSNLVAFRENLPEQVLTDILANTTDSTIVDVYTIGATLISGSSTPYGFTLDTLGNLATTVKVSHNGSPYRSAYDGERYEAIGRYSFHVTSALGETEAYTLYVVPPKEYVLEAYFPNGILNGQRVFDMESNIPVWELGTEFSLPKEDNMPPLTVTLLNLDSNNATIVGDTLQLNQPGRYLLTIDTLQENTPGTNTRLQFVFILGVTDHTSTLNRRNLLNSNEIYQFKASHYEVDVEDGGQIIHLLFSSFSKASSVAKQYDSSVRKAVFDPTNPDKYHTDSTASERWLFANAVERELLRSPTQLIPHNFVFVPCESVQVLAFAYSDQRRFQVPYGVEAKDIFHDGRYRITEVFSNGRTVEYDVIVTNQNHTAYTLSHDGQVYTVSGEPHRRVFAATPVTISSIVNPTDPEGIITIDDGGNVISLPIAGTLDITLTSGIYHIRFLDRLGQEILLDLDIKAEDTAFPLEAAVAPTDENTTSAKEPAESSPTIQYSAGALVIVGLVLLSSMLFVKKLRRKTK